MKSLLQPARTWQLRRAPPDRAEQIARELGCSPALAKVLAARAPDNPHKLLATDLEQLHSPWDLAGMRPAVERIARALQGRERIFIHGDFDVDGLTSAALLYLALRDLGCAELKVETEDRERGHGLNPGVVRRVSDEKFSLLITTDCGISDVDLVAALQDAAVDVIITDHHHPPQILPRAHAIINPKLPDCSYPNKDLAAVGVVFQLIRALHEHLGQPPSQALALLDLVMLGTVGDLVPLVHGNQAENKLLVRGGLDLVAKGGGRLGLCTLLAKLSLDARRLTAGELSFTVVPKLNAANRVGDPKVAFLLLTTRDRQKAEYWADILLDYNHDRQTAHDDLLFQVEEIVRREVDLGTERMLILSGKYWNTGILGLVASDLVEQYHRPVILISVGDSESRASGRSIPDFNLIESLERHRGLFVRYGGHAMAAGFTIANEKIPVLTAQLSAYAREKLAGLPGLRSSADAVLEPEQITLGLHRELSQLAPFGTGHPAPRFLLRGARVLEAQTVGNGSRHLKLRLAAGAGQAQFECIGFELGNYIAEVYQRGLVDLVFKLGRNDWTGTPQVQLEIEDVLVTEPAPTTSHSI